MKKLFLASAVAALSVTAAQAAPTVYGKAFVTLDYVEDGRTQLQSNFSRIGFKGAEALTANTDFLYQLEYAVDIDADNGKNFRSRDTFVGLSNKKFGTALAGRLTAIDSMVDYANVTDGGLVSGVMTTFDAPRANGALAYVSPSYNGVSFLGMYVLDEGDNVTVPDFGLTRDVVGVGAKYEPNGANYRAGATYIQAGDAAKVLRVSGAYDLSQATTIGAMFQNHKDVENVVTLSATHKYGQTPWTVYGQIDLADYEGGGDAQRLVVGGRYAFNKATTGHVYTVAGDDGNDTSFGIGGGIEYRF